MLPMHTHIDTHIRLDIDIGCFKLFIYIALQGEDQLVLLLPRPSPEAPAGGGVGGPPQPAVGAAV